MKALKREFPTMERGCKKAMAANGQLRKNAVPGLSDTLFWTTPATQSTQKNVVDEMGGGGRARDRLTKDVQWLEVETSLTGRAEFLPPVDE